MAPAGQRDLIAIGSTGTGASAGNITLTALAATGRQQFGGHLVDAERQSPRGRQYQYHRDGGDQCNGIRHHTTSANVSSTGTGADAGNITLLGTGGAGDNLDQA